MCYNQHGRKQIGFCCFDETTAHICAGPDKQKFLFHKRLLCHLAPFFNAALKGGFKEAENAEIEMPMETPSVIQRFRLWVYTDNVSDGTESLENLCWKEMIDLYIFADRYDLPDLQNATIDTMVAKVMAVKQIPSRYIPYIYDNTNAASPLRRLLIDWMTQRVNVVDSITPEKLDQNPEEYPPIFLLDLALAFYKLKKDSDGVYYWAHLGCLLSEYK